MSNNTYPWRGICLGVDESGEYAVIVYFIMGRSVNSRNRIFEETDDGIITKAHDESLMTDPHLIIYAPVRALPGGEYTIVTNGDQTDTVYDFIQNGQTFEDALRTRTFEDDRPNWTPRISGLVRVADGKASYKLSITSPTTATKAASCAISMSTRSPRRARDISSTPTSATAIRFRPSRANRRRWRCTATLSSWRWIHG